MNLTESQVADRRKAISEAFHTFNQPLTSLHCGLELALQKPRTEGEYRKRIEDALVNATEIFRLSKALRELVDAVDPGERFGTVAVGPLVAQVHDEISVLAEASQVSVTFQISADGHVAADPMKLLCMIGNVLTSVISMSTPGTRVRLETMRLDHNLQIRVVADGDTRPEEPSDLEQKLREIRLDAARFYCLTLGGCFSQADKFVEITLPLKIG